MTEAKKDGGPAFPLPGGAGDVTVHQTYLGMTLRDWFAGQVLAGVMVGVCAGQHSTKRADEEPPEFIARTAYNIADAMLAERAKATGADQ